MPWPIRQQTGEDNDSNKTGLKKKKKKRATLKKEKTVVIND